MQAPGIQSLFSLMKQDFRRNGLFSNPGSLISQPEIEAPPVLKIIHAQHMITGLKADAALSFLGTMPPVIVHNQFAIHEQAASII